MRLRATVWIAALFALVAWISVSLDPSPRQHASISVTATGKKNPAALASAVWLEQRDGPRLLDGSAPAGWERRGGAVVSDREQPATLRWEGVISVSDRLLLRRSPSSGIVAVSIDGRPSVEYDLYAPVPTSPLELRPFESLSSPLRRPRALVRAVLLWCALFATILLTLRRLATRYGRAATSATVLTRLELAMLAAPSLLVYVTVLLALWPAQMSSDSLDQWDQIMRGRFADWHPATQTMLMWVVTRPWRSPSAVAVFHVCALTAVTVLALREVGRLGAPRWSLWVAACAFPLVPMNSLMVTTFWKDVTYSIAVVWMFVLVMQLVRTRGACTSSTPWCAGWVVAGFLVMMTRHNGLLVALGIGCLCLVAFWGRGKRFFAWALTGLFGSLLLAKMVVLPRLGVDPRPKEAGAMVAMHVLAAHRAAGTPFSSEEERFLDSALPLANWTSSYDCQSSVPLYWHHQISYGVLAAGTADLDRLAIRKTLQRPLAYLRHQACLTSVLWRVVPFEGEGMAITPMGVEQVPRFERYGLRLRPKLLRMHSLVARAADWSAHPDRAWLLWRGALWLQIALLVSAGLALALRDVRWLLLAAPGVLNSASLGIAVGAPDLRYQYAVVMMGLLLTPLLFGRRVETTTGEARRCDP